MPSMECIPWHNLYNYKYFPLYNLKYTATITKDTIFHIITQSWTKGEALTICIFIGCRYQEWVEVGKALPVITQITAITDPFAK